MTLERLGVEPQTLKPVWVTWLDGDLIGQLIKLARGYCCPECRTAVDLARERGVVESAADTPNCRSVSDRCGKCGARLHFDNTPASDRAGLQWTKVAIGAPLGMPDLGLRAATMAAAAEIRRQRGEDH